MNDTTDYWVRNLHARFAGLPTALGFAPRCDSPSAAANAHYEAARALFALEHEIAFDIATSGGRSGLQDSSGVRIDEVRGELGVRFAMVGMVASRRLGEVVGHHVTFSWAAQEAERLSPTDPEGLLQRATDEAGAFLATRWHSVTRVAELLEGGARVPIQRIREALGKAREES